MAISLPGLSMPASDSSHVVDGLTTVPSHFGPKETMDRLEAEIRANGMEVFARIDHATGLPLKALAWQSTSGKTWLSYTEPNWTARRHGIHNAQAVLNKMADVLRTISRQAASPNE